MYPFGSGMPQPHATSGQGGYNANTQQAGMPAGVPFGAGWVVPTQHPHQQQQQQTNMHYQQHSQQQSYSQAPPYPSNSAAPYPTSHNTNPYPSHTASAYPTNSSSVYPTNNSSAYPTHNSSLYSANNSSLYSANSSSVYPTNNSSHYASNNSALYPTSSSSYHTAPYPSNQPPIAPNGAGALGGYPGSSYPHNPHQASYASSSSTSSSPSYHNPHYANMPSNHPTSYNPTHGYTPVRTSCGLESPAGNIQHCFEELAQRQGHPIMHNPIPSKELENNQSDLLMKELSTAFWKYLDGDKVDKVGNGTPTVLPATEFDPVKDAQELRRAMRGFGTDEDAIIQVVCRRTNEQRQEIQRQYKTHFGKDLIEDIKSETSGNFEKLLVGLLRPIVDYYCVELNDAMAGLGTDEDVLIEILCTLSNQEIHIIKNQYLRLYGAHLESELKSETSGNFKRLLVSLCTAARDESGQVDRQAAQNDARELLKAGELRVGTDESMFNMILCHRNYQQLKLIFQEYETMTGHSLEKAIKKEFSGDIMEGLIAICRCVTNKAEYFASRLHKSMAGIGTNDKQLIRVIITRCEIDLADIKSAYERMYSKSLKSWIKGDTSGHYKHALYALCNEQRSNS